MIQIESDEPETRLRSAVLTRFGTDHRPPQLPVGW